MTGDDVEARRRAVVLVRSRVGVAVMAYGLVGLLGASDATQPRNLGAFFLGAGIVHDVIVAPVVVLVGWLIARVLPPFVRPPVWFALARVACWWPSRGRWCGAGGGEPPTRPFCRSTTDGTW